MRAKVATVLVLFVLSGIASSLAASPGDTRQQTSRRVAPDFSISRFSDGRNVSLSDVRGKVVLLYFFFPS